MPAVTPPGSTAEFLDLVRRSEIHPPAAFDERAEELAALPADPLRAAEALVQERFLTRFQAKLLMAGKHKGFRLGSYVIQDLLGQGGMGSVYLAEHAALRRRVALKVLRAQRGEDAKVGVERFLREARAAAALDHPNIVRIHDVAQQGDTHYLVMEYVEGQTLDRAIARGGISPSLAVGYVAQAAAGLQHAHEKGFIHRDIKPANLILGPAGTVKILDMGLARSLTSAADNLTELLDNGAVVGTADYIAPEQALGGGTPVDIRADIYSLGATFFALVSGGPPFRGNTSQKLAQHQMKPPPDLAEHDRTFPPELAAVVSKMLAKQPHDRYQTPADVIAALAPWLSDDGEHKVAIGLSGTEQGSSGRLRETLAGKRSKRTETKLPAAAPPEGEPADAGAPRKKSRALIGAAVAGSLLVAALVGYAAWPGDKPAPPPGANPNHPEPVAAAPNPAGVPAKPANAPGAPKAKVTITSGPDGFRVQAVNYEAVIDKADGCISSFRVAGTEFLRNGAALSNGRTTARGGYFYYEKAGHQGLVKLPEVKQTAPNKIVATGGPFSVAYEFGPTALTVTGQNATDDAVPYYVLFDSDAVHDVTNAKGETLSVPTAPRTQAEPLDPKWRTTTWIAGAASVKVTDSTEDATTKIWGPFSPFRSQVWESVARTYNRIQFTLEPAVGAEETAAPLTPGAVLVSRAGPVRRVRAELYDATIDRDGTMPSLRVDGVEVLKSGIGVSRGVYFLPGYPLVFDVTQPAPTVVTAQSDKAAVRYDFAADKMTWTVENRSDKGMPFFVVLDTSATAVRNGKGEWAKLPVTNAVKPDDSSWGTVTWYAGRAKLTMTGTSRVWGPWMKDYQVWEASLAPKEKRVITVAIGLTDAAEAEKLRELTGTKPALATGLTLDAPMDYQVFQRKTRSQGAITVRGRVRADFDKLEVRTLGKPLEGALPDQWRALPVETKNRSFEATVPTPAGGWYKVAVRALKGGKVVGEMAVEHVGVGEVFVGAGQSNSTNCGQEKIQQKSGMVSSFSGTGWRPGDDPQPGVHDNTAGGSYWPAFGDAMFERYGVPIGVASTGHSGTSVDQWAPGGELCRWTSARMKQLGPNGFRAVLWHQGESDVAMPPDEYARKMTALIRETQKAAGREVPWFVAQVSYHNPNQVSFPNPRAGQKKLWDAGVALEGPDTDTLTGDNRDEGGKGIHFSPKGLRAHGKLWAEKVAAYLDKELLK